MKKLLSRLLSYLPSRLPQGMQEFEKWASSIIVAFETPDNDSIRFALASAILHLPSTAAYKPKAYFGHVLTKGAASQVALGVMEDLKAKQKAAMEAAQLAAQAEAAVTAEQVSMTAASTTLVEATTPSSVATNVKPA